MSTRLVLASNNAKKAAEMQALLAPLGIEVIPQSVFGVGEAEEPHPSFVENALAKARHASAATGLPAVADDSGLCVEALGGAPGVISARFAGEPKSDARNNALLLEKLAHLAEPTPPTSRTLHPIQRNSSPCHLSPRWLDHPWALSQLVATPPAVPSPPHPGTPAPLP